MDPYPQQFSKKIEYRVTKFIDAGKRVKNEIKFWNIKEKNKAGALSGDKSRVGEEIQGKVWIPHEINSKKPWRKINWTQKQIEINTGRIRKKEKGFIGKSQEN